MDPQDGEKLNTEIDWELKDDLDSMNTRLSQPLYLYAAELWPHHFGIANIPKDNDLWLMAPDLCNSTSTEPPDWFIWYWQLESVAIEPPPEGLSSLMIAAVANLTTITEHLVQNGVELGSQTTSGDTTLHLAAK